MYRPDTNISYLAIGALIYAIVSALWVAVARSVGHVHSSLVLGGATVLLALLVGAAAWTLLRAARVQASPESSSELGKAFGIIFAAQGVGIGVGSGVLAGFGQARWIAPWVAVVVGLHFFPLAHLLKLFFDYVLGAAILLWVGTIVLSLPSDGWASYVALGTALLLWLAGWGRLWVAHRAVRSIGERKL
jgi:hypothetical protein